MQAGSPDDHGATTSEERKDRVTTTELPSQRMDEAGSPDCDNATTSGKKAGSPGDDASITAEETEGSPGREVHLLSTVPSLRGGGRIC